MWPGVAENQTTSKIEFEVLRSVGSLAAATGGLQRSLAPLAMIEATGKLTH